MNLAERNATNAEARQKFQEQRNALHERRALALHIQTQTKPQQEQLDAIERSEALTNTLLPMITPYTVGPLGRTRQGLQSILGLLPPIAEKQLEDLRQQGLAEARDGTLGPTPQDNSAWAIFLGRFDPRMDKIAFYKGVLAYAHAKAQKGAGLLRVQDITRADQLFSKADSAATLVNLLNTNQTFLHGERARVQKRRDEITKQLAGEGLAPSYPASAPSGDAPGTLSLPKGYDV